MYKLSNVGLLLFSLFLMISSPHKILAQTLDIIGPTTAEEIREKHRIFDIYTNRYIPNSKSISYLKEIQDSVKINVFFGTWCHDSKKQVPAFIKTIELAKNSLIEVEYVAVTKNKNDPNKLSDSFGLKYTPTFIIYRNNKEYGRIIEEPEFSIEEDLVLILKSEPISED